MAVTLACGMVSWRKFQHPCCRCYVRHFRLGGVCYLGAAVLRADDSRRKTSLAAINS